MREARRRRAKLELPDIPGAFLVLIAGCLSLHPSSAAGRVVLGTLRTLHAVEWRAAAGQWRPALSGSVAAGGTCYRAGADSAALLLLGPYGMVGLRPQTEVELGEPGPGVLPLRVVSGGVLFRLARSSRLRLLAFGEHGGSLRVGPATIGGERIEGTMTILAGGQVEVSVAKGAVELSSVPGGTSTLVRAGEVATARSVLETPAVRLASAEDEAAGAETRKDRRCGLGVFAVEPRLGVLAAAAAGMVVVGGTVGGLAAAGQFTAGGGGQQARRVRHEASPFLP